MATANPLRPHDPDWHTLAETLGTVFAARAARHDRDGTFAADNFADLKAAGLFAAGVPSELGGGGAGYVELAAMLRHLARHCGSTALAFSMHTHQVATAAWRWRNQNAPLDGLLRRVARESLLPRRRLRARERARRHLAGARAHDGLGPAGAARRFLLRALLTGGMGSMGGLAFGDIRVTRVVESEEALLKPGEVYPDSTPEIIRANHDWLVPRHYDPATDGLVITIQSYLVRTPRHTILVDACGGNDKARARPHFDHRHHPWLDTLRAAGAAPEEIDFVLCTHMHVDHVGWNTRLENGRWVPTFPNARYLFARKELEHWEREARETGLPRTGDYVVDSVLPIIEAKRHVLVEMDHAIEDRVVLYPLAGHTPGQVGLHFHGGGREGLVVGDLMHHALQCKYPDWSTNFCTDPAAARVTRKAVFERYADTDTVIFPAHFPSPSGGVIRRAGPGSYRFDFVNE